MTELKRSPPVRTSATSRISTSRTTTRSVIAALWPWPTLPVSATSPSFIMEDGCGDDGAEALAASPYLGNLQNLYFSHHHAIRDRGALALANSSSLRNVTFLHHGRRLRR